MPPKNPTFKSPLIDKKSHPVSYSIFNPDGRITFDEFDNAFILRRLSQYCNHKSVTADFVPRSQESQENGNTGLGLAELAKYKDERMGKCYAVYNADNRHYTPAFLVGQDLALYVENPVYDYDNFKAKLQQVQARMSQKDQGTEQILVPRPSGMKCQICKSQFKDYQEHIKEERHLKKFRGSLGWKYTQELISDFHKKKNQRNLKKNNPEKDQKPKKQTKQPKRKTKVEQLVQEISQNRQKFRPKAISKHYLRGTIKRPRISGLLSTYNTIIS